MKRKVLIEKVSKKAVSILVILLFFSVNAYSASNCFSVAKKLWALQNKIVDKSFRKLPYGAWAQYSNNIKAVYLGQQVSAKTKMRLFVVEFQGKTVGQIWYKFTPKDVKYQNKILRFWTLEPMEAYALIKGKVYYISKAMIETFMSMNGDSWSTILKEGKILSPPNCNEVPQIREILYTLPGGKKVKAAVIISTENKSKLYCSPDVPFGMIKTVNSSGYAGSGELVDFGFSSKTVKISKSSAAKAIPMPIFPGAGNMKKQPPNFPIPPIPGMK